MAPKDKDSKLQKSGVDYICVRANMAARNFFCQQILLFIAISLLNYALFLDLLCLYIFTAFKGVQFIFIIPV